MTSKGFGNIEDVTPAEMMDILFSVLKWFKKRGLGNPFNYNRGFEFIQAQLFGFELTTVGGGSDGVKKDGTTALSMFFPFLDLSFVF